MAPSDLVHLLTQALEALDQQKPDAFRVACDALASIDRWFVASMSATRSLGKLKLKRLGEESGPTRVEPLKAQPQGSGVTHELGEIVVDVEHDHEEPTTPAVELGRGRNRRPTPDGDDGSGAQ